MFHKHARIALSVLGLAAALTQPSLVVAECRVSTTNGVGGVIVSTAAAPAGQSFVACQDGVITNLAIQVGFSTQNSVVLGVRAGTDLLTNTYSIPGTLTGGQRILFAPGIPVKGGELYSFSLAPVSGVLRLVGGEPTEIPDGTALIVQNGVTQAIDSDLEFSVTIEDPPVPVELATWGRVKSIYR